MAIAQLLIWLLTTIMKKHFGSREKLNPGEYTVPYPGKFRLKVRLFHPAIFAGN